MASDLLEAALGYARLGWPIFPCRHDKTPYTPNGVLDATADLAQIEKWWQRWPGANIALAAGEARLLVLDYDPGSSRAAAAAALGGDLPETKLVARTPRGGEHHYYLLDAGDEPVPSRVSPFAEKVDTRSFRGYVLLPPSHTRDGAYSWLSQGRPARRSDALLAACGRPTPKSAERDQWAIEPDLAENVALARAWLRGERAIGSGWCRPAIQGAGGDNTTYATAAMMKSCGLSEGTALEVMWEEWNERCDPPWDYDDLATKIRNGYAYNTSPPGNVTPAYHVAKLSGTFQPLREEELGDKGRQVVSGRFRFIDRDALAAVNPPEWLVPDAIPVDAYAMLAGPSRSYKTFAALDMALCVATGSAGGGLWGAPSRPGPVLFVVGEGRAGLRLRVEAWETLHGARAERFVLADPVPHIHDPALKEFLDGALKWHPGGYRLVVLDTIARAMQGANENAQENATAFTRLADVLRRELGASVLALHHSGHENQDRARGSSAFTGDPDTIIMAARHGKDKVRLTMAKQKDWPEWDEPRWGELKTVEVNGRPSLAAVKCEAPKNVAGPDSRLSLALVDQHALAALRRYPMTEFADRALAQVMAAEGVESGGGEIVELGASEESIRKSWLPKLRERGSGARVQGMYDPLKKRWRYSPAAAGDFDPA